MTLVISEVYKQINMLFKDYTLGNLHSVADNSYYIISCNMLLIITSNSSWWALILLSNAASQACTR